MGDWFAAMVTSSARANTSADIAFRASSDTEVAALAARTLKDDLHRRASRESDTAALTPWRARQAAWRQGLLWNLRRPEAVKGVAHHAQIAQVVDILALGVGNGPSVPSSAS